MPHELALPAASVTGWRAAIVRLSVAWTGLFALTFAEWRAMAHQWWNIDTYNHVLLVPAILAGLVWLRRNELARLEPRPSSPGLLWLAAGLTLWVGGRAGDINLLAQAGVVIAFQGALVTLLGVRTMLVLAFPLAYAVFLVPFGDELIPALQQVTADIAIGLTRASGVPLVVHGLTIDTPGGKFVVAEECSGVKFLIAMTALGVLVAWTGFTRWQRRLALVGGAVLVSIMANGARAWGTIYVAQWIGAERAGGFDHIVYGWVFFALVVAVVLGVAWRFLERDPADAGLTAQAAAEHPLGQLDRHRLAPDTALGALAGIAIAFALLVTLV